MRIEMSNILEKSNGQGVPFGELPGIPPEDGVPGFEGTGLIGETMRLVANGELVLDFSGPQMKVVKK